MNHQELINEWTALLVMIGEARPNTDHPHAVGFLDATEEHARAQLEFMVAKKAEADAKEKP